MITQINIGSCEVSGCTLADGTRATTLQSNTGSAVLIFDSPESIYQLGKFLADEYERHRETYTGPIGVDVMPELPQRRSCLDL